VLILACASAIGALYIEFQLRLETSEALEHQPRTGVVFTGQFERIQFGLSLLKESEIDRLFVSGVNSGAGLDRDRFDGQFELSPELKAARVAGHIVLADDANTTLENAIETFCWIAIQADVQAVTLVTSRHHMPRASLALERALPAGFLVARVVSGTQARSERSALLQEFPRFVATWIVTLGSFALWTAEPSLFCEE